MTETTTQINLLDRNYTIRCSEQQTGILEQSAKLIEESVTNYQKDSQMAFTDAILLTTLNICGEYIASQINSTPGEQQANLSSEQLTKINKLDKLVKEALAPNI